jgi:hypothetical protein
VDEQAKHDPWLLLGVRRSATNGLSSGLFVIGPRADHGVLEGRFVI